MPPPSGVKTNKPFPNMSPPYGGQSPLQGSRDLQAVIEALRKPQGMPDQGPFMMDRLNDMGRQYYLSLAPELPNIDNRYQQLAPNLPSGDAVRLPDWASGIGTANEYPSKVLPGWNPYRSSTKFNI